MHYNPGEWPKAGWQLTAPESYVLRYGAYQDAGVEPFKLAVKELVVRRALLVKQTETRRFLGRIRACSALKEGPRAAAVTEPSLTIVLALYRRLAGPRSATGRRSGAPGNQNGAVPMTSFVRAARKQFGGRLGKYRDPHVVGALAQRGLVEKAADPLATVFPRTRWFWTDAGAAADENLERWLTIGRLHLRRWVWDDPSRALAYAGGAGASILLLNQLHGVELGGLAQRVHERAGWHAGSGGEGLVLAPAAASGTEGAPAPTDPAGDHWPGVDALGDLDFGAFDFGALDGIGGEFVAFDVGAGGGGGGDGGGG
jgi:hypothetical protein